MVIIDALTIVRVLVFLCKFTINGNYTFICTSCAYGSENIQRNIHYYKRLRKASRTCFTRIYRGLFRNASVNSTALELGEINYFIIISTFTRDKRLKVLVFFFFHNNYKKLKNSTFTKNKKRIIFCFKFKTWSSLVLTPTESVPTYLLKWYCVLPIGIFHIMDWVVRLLYKLPVNTYWNVYKHSWIKHTIMANGLS